MAGETHNHRAHPKVNETGGSQTSHHRINQRESRTTVNPRLQLERIILPYKLAVGWMKRLKLHLRLAFEPLNKVIPPVEPT